jgi:hypothetical protein
VPEAELQEQMRHDRKWQVTEQPKITLSKNDAASSAAVATVQCSTQGASLAYKVEHAGNERARWLLYSKPVTVDSGSTVTAVACRLGWKDSAEVSVPVN